MKIFFISALFFVTGCAEYLTPPLPDIDAQSFSYTEVMQQKQNLQQQIEKMRELDKKSS